MSFFSKLFSIFRRKKKKVNTWEFQYSPGMSNPEISGESLSFNFPLSDGVHYLTRPYSDGLNGKTIRISGEILGLNPVFDWKRDTCDVPARARIMIQKRNDDMRSANGRWWSCENYIDLKIGAFVIEVPVTYDKWTNVYGQKNASEFELAMNNVGRIGLTFSGGCSFGHGAWLSSGTARMIINKVSIS